MQANAKPDRFLLTNGNEKVWPFKNAPARCHTGSDELS